MTPLEFVAAHGFLIPPALAAAAVLVSAALGGRVWDRRHR